MDGTKRTAFASALYFLAICGHPRPRVLPIDDVIHFCLDLAEENIRQAEDPSLQPKTITEIADWFRWVLRSERNT